MAFFELSAKRKNNGRRDFKLVLHEIYPDSCVANKIGTIYNGNGCCWIEQYVRENLDSIQGMSLTAEFLDKEKTELNGHGLTSRRDGIPIFENAEIIGNFSRGDIEDVDFDGTIKRCCVGYGEIDEMRYYNFVQELEKRFANGDAPLGSVEIISQVGQEAIQYLNGKYETGRIPVLFSYSGMCLLGIEPSDHTCKILELNEKQEDESLMDELKKMLGELSAKIEEYYACQKKTEELNATIAEQNASVEQLQAALDAVREELKAANEKCDQLWEEARILRDEVAKAKVKERVGELNSALTDYTEEEKKFAEAEIAAFEADPMSVEINSITDKINIEIGKAAKAAAKAAAEAAAAEQSQRHEINCDIFSEINFSDNNAEANIF